MNLEYESKHAPFTLYWKPLAIDNSVQYNIVNQLIDDLFSALAD